MSLINKEILPSQHKLMIQKDEFKEVTQEDFKGS